MAQSMNDMVDIARIELLINPDLSRDWLMEIVTAEWGDKAQDWMTEYVELNVKSAFYAEAVGIAQRLEDEKSRNTYITITRNKQLLLKEARQNRFRPESGWMFK